LTASRGAVTIGTATRFLVTADQVPVGTCPLPGGFPMRSRALLVAFLLACLPPGPASAQPGVILPSAPPPRATWEYKELSRTAVEALAGKEEKERFVAGLNKLGAEGWELVAVDPTAKGAGRYLFKRPGGRAAGERAEGKPPSAAAEVPTPIQIVRLKNARAADTAKLLMAVFGKAAGLQVIADDRTNSLLVGGSLDQQAELLKLVVELDNIDSDAAAPRK
jgi:hypothetical protein